MYLIIYINAEENFSYYQFLVETLEVEFNLQPSTFNLLVLSFN